MLIKGVDVNGNIRWIMWILGVLITIAASVGGYAVARVDTVQKSLQLEYVQKIDYREDMSDLKRTLRDINNKMDRVLNRVRGD